MPVGRAVAGEVEGDDIMMPPLRSADEIAEGCTHRLARGLGADQECRGAGVGIPLRLVRVGEGRPPDLRIAAGIGQRVDLGVVLAVHTHVQACISHDHLLRVRGRQ